MLLLDVEEDVIYKYSVRSIDSYALESELRSILKEKQEIVAKRELVSSETAEQFATKGNIVFHGFNEKSADSRQIFKVTTKTIYNAPTTMAFCVNSGIDTKIGDAVDAEMFKELKNNSNYMLLSNLLKSVQNREVLYRILTYFKEDPTLLEEFLRTYHPDLYHFRKIVSFLKLVQEGWIQLSKVNDSIQTALKLGDVNSSDSLKSIVDAAQDNSQIQKRLSLEFASDDDNDLPF